MNENEKKKSRYASEVQDLSMALAGRRVSPMEDRK